MYVEQQPPRNVKVIGETLDKQDTIISVLGGVWDYLALTEAATTDTWVYKIGGAGGTTVKTKVVTYTDSGKGTISNVTVT